MKNERHYKVLLAPHISEKTSGLAESEKKQIVFKVLPNANKAEIKAAVEAMFSVKVDNVCVINAKAKRKRFKQIEGKRSAWKKAYVTLQPGQDIDFADAAS